MTRYKIGKVEEISPGERRIVAVAGRSIGVFNVNGAFYALKNVCIHNQAPVCLGELSGTFLPSAPDEYRWGMEGQVLRCPWHGWEFDVATGCSLFDPETRLVTYPVQVEDGQIYVEVRGKRS
ncbi:MAG: Rieske (2Fe-2S) protein [Ardenticatenaceae bacterium]|nr:Rieske (2Fe-2S) protein [Ardenticatenaceae bacterium]